MKTLPILIITIFVSTISFGQNKHVPKNLKQAVKYLNSDCPDSLKAIVKITDNNKLEKLTYPWGGNYKTINDWTSGDNKDSKIVKYLSSKGIYKHVDEVILVAFKLYILNGKIDERIILKPYQEIELKWKKEDSVKYTTDSLRGVYIPKDIEDCIKQINGFWSDSIKTQVKSLSENDFSARVHLGFGMWIRNNWQLWGGSRLSQYFNNLGIYHPDDMSGIILDSYYRSLSNKEIKLEEQIQYYKDYWEKSKIDEKKRDLEEFKEYHLNDTVEFSYRNGFVSKKQEEKYDNDICIAHGIITELNENDLLIKVKLIESCDNKGIIYYDNKSHLVYDKKTQRWTKPKKRIIKRLKKNQEFWFKYKDWETKE